MIKKIVGVSLVSLLIVGCTAVKFDGNRTGNDEQFIIEYEMLNGTDSQLLTLEAGDKVAVNIVTDSGKVEVEVGKEDEEPIYTGMNVPNIAFVLEIPESGIYKCSVTGKKAKGSVSFIKQEIEEAQELDELEIFMGYLWIENDTVYVDKVEVITTEQEARIEELGLTVAKDLPSGYYIHNEKKEVDTFELTANTMYHFTDMNLLFTKDEVTRAYETSDIKEFREASSYQDQPLEEQKIPYKIEVHGNKVRGITEEFMFTQ